MTVCGYCGADDVVGVEAQLRAGGYSWGLGQSQSVRGLGPVKPVAEQTAKPDSYGEYVDESEIWVVVYVSSLDRYFQKYGTTDSYGDDTWDGKFEEVFPQERTVTVYERKSA